jgi:glucoselysine-6-phosphate deglycase
MTARLLMEKNLKVEVKVVTPFEFENYETDFLEDAFVFAISQSGRSTNILSALDKLNEMGIETIALTGFPDSEVKNHSKLVVDLQVGIETVGYVTKGFTNTVLFLMLFSSYVAKKTGLLSDEEAKIQETSMLRIFESYEHEISKSIDFYKKHKSVFLRMKRLQICGYGPNFGTAMEGALKIGETYGIPSTPYDLEEFMHGGYLELTPESVVFLVDSDGKGHKRTMELYEALQLATKKVFVIGSMKLPQNEYTLRVNEELVEWTSPLVLVVLFQVLAHMICTDLDIWEKEKYIDEFEEMIASKTEKPEYLK